tara:strand:+ start:493 stop:1101 length:609 start_codon:yes stop_codon:yes gene_type:complete
MRVEQYLKNNFKPYKIINWQGQDFHYFEIKELPDARVLMTSGLSDFKMKVHEKHLGEEFAELYILLPGYWDESSLKESENEWVFKCLSKTKRHIKESNTWFGHGHTFSFKDMELSVFKASNETQFIVSNPIQLKPFLPPLRFEDHSIIFLSIIPVFEKEVYFKESRGTFKLMEKFRQYGVTEKIDAYRESAVKSRFNRLFKR